MAEAEALALNALVLAILFGVIFAGAEWLFGEAVYRLLGGQAEALGAALEYGHVIFSSAVFVWIVSLLAAALRGAGNTVVPAAVILLGVFVLLPLSPALIFGWGPFPRLGVMGAGLAVVVYYLVAAIVLIVYMRSARAALHLPLDATLIKWRLLRDILRVGGLSAIGTIQANLTVVLVTGAVGLFGTDAIAGYGIASRLDYIQIPIVIRLHMGPLYVGGGPAVGFKLGCKLTFQASTSSSEDCGTGSDAFSPKSVEYRPTFANIAREMTAFPPINSASLVP